MLSGDGAIVARRDAAPANFEGDYGAAAISLRAPCHFARALLSRCCLPFIKMEPGSLDGMDVRTAARLSFSSRSTVGRARRVIRSPAHRSRRDRLKRNDCRPTVRQDCPFYGVYSLDIPLVQPALLRGSLGKADFSQPKSGHHGEKWRRDTHKAEPPQPNVTCLLGEGSDSPKGPRGSRPTAGASLMPGPFPCPGPVQLVSHHLDQTFGLATSRDPCQPTHKTSLAGFVGDSDKPAMWIDHPSSARVYIYLHEGRERSRQTVCLARLLVCIWFSSKRDELCISNQCTCHAGLSAAFPSEPVPQFPKLGGDLAAHEADQTRLGLHSRAMQETPVLLEIRVQQGSHLSTEVPEAVCPRWGYFCGRLQGMDPSKQAGKLGRSRLMPPALPRLTPSIFLFLI